MTTTERNSIRGEIRGITLPMIWTFILGTATVCGVVITGVSRVEKTFENHESRLSTLEKSADKALENHETRISELEKKAEKTETLLLSIKTK